MKHLFLLFLLISSIHVSAQELTVKGTVKERGGQTIPGATVVVRGTQNGTTTDVNGKFSIAIKKGAVLSFSFIGFKTQEISSFGNKELLVELSLDNQNMEEIVVVGYGSQRKVDITGAVSRVEMKDMNNAVVRSFDEALAGRVAGVQVSSGDGRPGTVSNIIIRGGNSLTQDNSPLYVIDDMPTENVDITSLSSSDIESIDILKDASATAIYGARGANGVIIIKTKRGVEGSPTITYQGSIGFQPQPNELSLLSPYEFVAYQKDHAEFYKNSTFYDKYTKDLGRDLEYYRDQKGYNWQDQIFRNVAPSTEHSIGISGGSKVVQYSANASYLNQNGSIINSGFERYRGKLTLDAFLSSKIKVGISSTYNNSITSGNAPSAGGFSSSMYLLYSVWGYRPIDYKEGDDLLNDGIDDDINGATDYRYNPVVTTQNEHKKTIATTNGVNAYFQYDIIKNLRFRSTFGYSNYKRQNEAFNNSKTRSGDPRMSILGVNGSILNQTYNDLSNENTLAYNLKVGGVKIGALAGLSFLQNTYNQYGYNSTKIPYETMGMSSLKHGSVTTLQSKESVWRQESMFGRLNFDLYDRYLLTATFRADGSSKFPSNNRWGYFPSAALAWRVSQESFMSNQNVFSNLKFRAGWGLTGNNRIPENSWMALLSTEDPHNGTQINYPFGDNYNNAMIFGTPENKQLKWETTEQINLGLDMSVLKDRISFTADLYTKTTKDLLMNSDVAPSLGFPRQMLNIGSIRNQGLELTLNATPVHKNDFTWNTSFNISFNRSEVLGLARNQHSLESVVAWDTEFKQIPAYISQIGKPVGLMYGYVWEGNYQYSDFDYDGTNYTLKANVPASGARSAVLPGQIKYRDLNGDNVVDANDYTAIGNPNPKHIGGFSNNFTYKNFDLNIFFQWSYGNEILNANRLVMENRGKVYTNYFESTNNRWTPENQNNEMFALGGHGAAAYSTRIVEDGSYLRLKTVTLGYTFPKTILRSMRMKSLRVYVSAQNLFTLDNYSGYDPEVSSRHTALTQGFDYSSYPRSLSFNFGIKIVL